MERTSVVETTLIDGRLIVEMDMSIFALEEIRDRVVSELVENAGV